MKMTTDPRATSVLYEFRRPQSVPEQCYSKDVNDAMDLAARFLARRRQEAARRRDDQAKRRGSKP